MTSPLTTAIINATSDSVQIPLVLVTLMEEFAQSKITTALQIGTPITLHDLPGDLMVLKTLRYGTVIKLKQIMVEIRTATNIHVWGWLTDGRIDMWRLRVEFTNPIGTISFRGKSENRIMQYQGYFI